MTKGGLIGAAAFAAGFLTAVAGDLNAPPVMEQQTVGSEILKGYHDVLHFRRPDDRRNPIDQINDIVKGGGADVGYLLGATFAAADYCKKVIDGGGKQTVLNATMSSEWLTEMRAKQKELDLTDAQVASALGLSVTDFQQEVVAISADAFHGVQAAAIAKYPDLKRSGSVFNNVFLRLYQEAQTDNPGLLDDPSWPMQLADKAAQEVEAMKAMAPKTQLMDPSPLDQPAQKVP